MTNNIKSRPIIFSSEMVNSILERRKFQTRRVIKPDPRNFYDPKEGVEAESYEYSKEGHSGEGAYFGWTDYAEEGSEFIKCPHGEIGDKLWVKENYFLNKNHNNIPSSQAPQDSLVMYQAGGGANVYGKKRSSMFMPKWASRLTLEITNIRVERLQDISEEDAINEGIESWDQNPFCWIIEFKVSKNHK